MLPPPHRIKPWIFFNAPFESGDPNPEITQNPTGHGTSLEAWANPVNGNISLALVGGTVATGFPDPNNPSSSIHGFPMPDKWFGGDAVHASGTITQTINLQNKNLPAAIKMLSVTATFFCASNNMSGIANYENNMWLVAGKVSAPLTGMAGMHGALNLNLQNGAYDGAGNFIAQTEASQQSPFLTKIIINSGATVGEYPTTVIYDNWSMEPYKFGVSVLKLSAKIALNPNQNILKIHAGAILTGFRGGSLPINDISSAYVSGSFQDIPAATRIFQVNQQNSPLQLNRLEVFFS